MNVCMYACMCERMFVRMKAILYACMCNMFACILRSE